MSFLSSEIGLYWLKRSLDSLYLYMLNVNSEIKTRSKHYDYNSPFYMCEIDIINYIDLFSWNDLLTLLALLTFSITIPDFVTRIIEWSNFWLRLWVDQYGFLPFLVRMNQFQKLVVVLKTSLHNSGICTDWF